MSNFSSTLLEWYDVHARSLPWRVSPSQRKEGVRPDPYRVWLSEIMLQQTTVSAVTSYFKRFTLLWPTIEALAGAPDEEILAEWAGLGYYARARNLIKCARAVTAQGGFPQTREGLETLPGIGPYTSAAIAAIAFDEPAPVMDGNVERVMSRVFDVETPLPDSKPALFAHVAELTPRFRPGDYAQAVMDLGATICTPRSPSCMICPVAGFCASLASGRAEALPRKRAKAPKPERCGHIYFVMREDDAILLETRPAKGLLGGMRGFPGGDWVAGEAPERPPLSADWQTADERITHVFTHFKLTLTVHVGRVSALKVPQIGDFVPIGSFRSSDLPSVMRKVFDCAMKLLEKDRVV